MSDEDKINKEVDEYFKRAYGPAPSFAPEAQAPRPQAAQKPSEKPAEKPAEEPTKESAASIYDQMREAYETPAAPQEDGRQPITGSFNLTPGQEQAITGGAGAYVGSKVGPALSTTFPSREQREAEALRRIRESISAQRTYQDLVDQELLRRGIRPESPATTSGEKWARNWAGQERPGVGGVPEASAAYQRSKGQGKVTGRMSKIWGPAGPNEPAALVDRLLQRSASAAQQEEQVRQAMEAASRGAVQQVRTATPGVLSRLGTMVTGPKVTGALGGAGAGLSAYEAYQRYQEGDRSGAVIAALGGLGGLASLVPGLGAPGAAIGLGSIPAMYINDILKGKVSAPQLPQQTDIMGNPIPGP